MQRWPRRCGRAVCKGALLVAGSACKSTGASTPPVDHALHGRALALVFFGLLLAMFISSLSETIASTALPTIVGDLNGVEIMQWVSTAYILSSTLVMPIYGKLGDLSAASVSSWRRSRCTPRAKWCAAWP